MLVLIVVIKMTMEAKMSSGQVIFLLVVVLVPLFILHNELVKKSEKNGYQNGLEAGFQYAEDHCQKFDDEWVTEEERRKYEQEKASEEAEFNEGPNYRN